MMLSLNKLIYLSELALTYCTVLWGASYNIVIEQVNYPYELAVTYCTVLRGRGDDVVIERVELDVQHHPRMTTDVWGLGVHPPTLQHKGQNQRLKLQTLFFLHMQCVNNVRISKFYKSAKSCKPTFICIREKLHDDHENLHNCWEYFLISIYHNKSILENIKNVTNATSISKTNIIVDIF